MSTNQHTNDSSLNNQPKRDAKKLEMSGISSGSTSVSGGEKGKEAPIPTDTNNTNAQEKSPIDRHGDTWGGGIPFENKQFK